MAAARSRCMAMALLLYAAATAAVPPPSALPGCNTTCGDVSVPYPFGFGPSHCYWPGLNLTCDTSHRPPRLLLGDGTLRVTEISVRNATVRVVPTGGAVINATGDFTTDRWDVPFGRGFTEHGYTLSSDNELVVYGCNVLVTVLADLPEEATRRVGGCASFCTKIDLPVVDGGGFLTGRGHETGTSKFCIDRRGCCRAPVTNPGKPVGVQARWIDGGDNHTVEQKEEPLSVFVAEQGWVDENGDMDGPGLYEAPIVLQWRVIKGLPERSQDILYKSEHTMCWSDQQGYWCQCEEGYDGNPYLPSGCQDIDECKLPNEETRCFGECINTIGSMECRCPHGAFGNPGVKGGCVKIHSTTAGGLLPTVEPAPVGLPDCKTTCGDVSVPYPFGISPRCSLPGFSLTCNTRYNPPRLLIDSNSTLEIVNIFLHNSSVNVIQHINNSMDSRWDDDNIYYMASFELPDIGEPYMLSTRHEFIVSGCDLHATLYGEYRNDSSSNTTDRIISGCNSTTCSSNLIPINTTHNGYCHAPILAGSTPRKVEIRKLRMPFRPLALISEEGLSHQWHMISNITNLWMASQYEEYFGYGVSTFESRLAVQYWASPLVLGWAVKQGFSAPTGNSGQCPLDVASCLCKSKDTSGCRQENGGFTCHCNPGYQGNPYIAGGCKVIDQCNITASLGNPCLGECINFPGGYKCQCPRGTHGNPFKLGGCSPAGLIIGLSVASGPALLLLVLGIILVLHKIKQRRVQVLKQKYFKQNRGQLLQQLVSQKADIAERMMVPVDELAKATNNFDKARELGGGGHGIVYKGILSDLHVVAIKKSKITVQKEIDEFINEVAILSQINHRNVVKLFGCCLETEVPLLVYEFISNGTLYHHLHVEGPKSLSWGNRLRIATEIATSLAYLHSAVSIPIIHRDIKSSNILLDDALTAKVSDFGASRYVPIEKTGLTTRVQGTIGYLDPMYFYTGRLTEKSDVYSFGVILVELLTRKKPFSYLSIEGDGLVAHFVNLFTEGNLVLIIDPQVIDEGGEEVQEVAALAVSCINLRGEERPMMRQVEHTLERSRSSKMYKKDDMVAAELENDSSVLNSRSSTIECQGFEEASTRYSLEQEMIMSARYPR